MIPFSTHYWTGSGALNTLNGLSCRLIG